MGAKHLAAIDGDTSLQAQQDRLNFGQNGFTAEVTDYARAAGGKPPNQFVHTNNVTFTEVDLGAEVRQISLVVVAEGEVANLNNDQELAFDNNIFVAGVVKRVVGVRPKK